VALREDDVSRRGAGEESECRESAAMRHWQGCLDKRDDRSRVQQDRRRIGDLNRHVRGDAERASSVRGIANGMRVNDLDSSAEDDQSHTQECKEEP